MGDDDNLIVDREPPSRQAEKFVDKNSASFSNSIQREKAIASLFYPKKVSIYKPSYRVASSIVKSWLRKLLSRGERRETDSYFPSKMIPGKVGNPPFVQWRRRSIFDDDHEHGRELLDDIAPHSVYQNAEGPFYRS